MRKIIIFYLISLFLATAALAQTVCPLNVKSTPPKMVKSLKTFELMALLEDGRIKPVDTYADNLLLQFSGRRTFANEDGARWLIKLLFAPQHTLEDKVFLINNPDILTALGMEGEKERRYSFAQLQEHIPQLQELAAAAEKIDSKERDVVEIELIRVFHNVRTFSELSFAFAFTFPHPDFYVNNAQLREQLGFETNKQQYSFIDLALKADVLQELMGAFERVPREQWNDAQQETVRIVGNLFQWTQTYQAMAFHVIPSYAMGDETWLSPWDAIAAGLHTPQAQQEMAYLNEMILAYWQGQQLPFDMNAKLFSKSVQQRMQVKDTTVLDRVALEHTYNWLNLLPWAKQLFLLVIVLFLVSLLKTNTALYKGSWVVTLAAFLLLASALILRIVILQRPPVSSLYETFVFVAFISVLTGLITERLNHQWLGIVISSISGFVFLTIADKFSMEGDTLKMLVAVLNSNFWLGTHVLSITTGYAGVCVAGIVGHVYILQSIFKGQDKELLSATYNVLIGTLGFGLIMTFLGTNLGGIWADQSWGRFWGWDPKENGALLIILWTALLFHAKVGKMIGPLGLAVGSILGIMVVMWAWFGVNLLSIGLHSYGFTSGLARNLTIYTIVQLLFILIFTPWAKARLKGRFP